MNIIVTDTIEFLMTRILVPTDFSDNALKAVTYAAEVAQQCNATIFLLHVIEPSINMATMQADSSRKKVVEERSANLNFCLKSIADVYPGVKVIPYLAGGVIITSILEYAKKKKVELIIMGTKGASGFKGLFMGSIAAGVVSKTKIPILTVPVSYEMEEPDAILLTTNQFEKNKNVLDKVVAISKLFSAAVHVVVFRDVDGDENADLIYNEDQLRDYVQFLKETFPGVVFKSELLEGKDFENAIDRYSNKNGVDLIAMITYPKSYVERLLRKSVTKKMTSHSTIPVLAIPAKG